MDPLLQAVSNGITVYDLSQPMEYGMPRAGAHPEFRMALTRRHGDHHRPDGTSSAGELIITSGHVGTHLDALAHFSKEGKLYNGADAMEAQRGGRMASGGIDEFAPGLFRGVLLDIPEVKDRTLEGGYGITANDLTEAASKHRVEIRSGDAVLVRTGWTRNWGDPDAYRGVESGVPGVTEDGAEYLASLGVAVVGSDTINFEQMHPGEGSRVLPVHRVLLTEQGINIIEVANLDPLSEAHVYEFSLVVAPLNVVGATGAPMRLLALTA